MKAYFIEKLKNNRQSLWLFSGNATITLLQFLILSLLSYLLPVEQFGTYRQLLTVISITVALGSFGFANSVYYFLSASANKEEKYSHINTARILIVLGAIVSVVLIGIFKPLFTKEFENPMFSNLFMLGLLVAFVQIIQTIDLNIMLDSGLLKKFLTSSISMIVIRIGLFAYLSVLSQPLEIYLWIIVITGILQVLWNYIWIERTFRHQKMSLQADQMKRHLLYALPLGVALFFGVMMNNADRLVLTHFIKDVKAFAILANGNFEVPVITNLYIAFSTIALPLMVQAFKGHDIKKVLDIRSTYIRQIAPVLFPIVFALIFWSTPIITLLFGTNYVESGFIFGIYSLSLFIRFANHNDIYLVTGKTGYIVIIQVIECLLSLLLNYILIAEYGIAGASVACVATNFIYFFVNSYISARILKQPFALIFPWRFLFICVLMSVLILLPFHYFGLNKPGNYIWMLWCAVYLGACGAMLFVFREKTK